jgi:UDP-glucose 4-epimerase
MPACLVTGGAGFIGSHLVEALVARGDRVRVLDNFSTGRPSNLGTVSNRINLVEGDLLDLDAVRRAVQGVDLVFHQAALASVSRSVHDPLATHQACATGTLHVLLAAKECGVRRVVYAASSSAYGRHARLPCREGDPTQPASPYAAAKLAGEHYCATFHRLYGLDTVRLRYFNVFGPRQPQAGPYAAVIPQFVAALRARQSPEVHGDGIQTRDFTYVSNVVQANLLAATSRGIGGRVYNIGCGQSTSLLALLAILNGQLGTSLPAKHSASRPGDVRHSRADITRAKIELHYRASVSLEEGLRRCLECCPCWQGAPSRMKAG